MIYKSYILEQNLNSIKDCKFFLFYGENIGLKNEFKKKIKQQYSKVDFINLFQDDILKNKEILINEVANKSLFKENKIIFIQQANDKILEILENVSEKLDNERIFIFSDVLDKRSKLRSFFEKNKSFGLTACYNDNEISIRKIIITSLKDFKNLSTEIVNLIIQNTNLDRNKVSNELEKIKSCFLDKKLEFTKIEELLNIRTNEDFNNLKDEVLNGNIDKFIEGYPGLSKSQKNDFLNPDKFPDWSKKYDELLTHFGFAKALISTTKNLVSLDEVHKKIDSLGIPVYTFWGRHDNVVVYDDFKDRLEDMLPNRKEFFIENSGHLPHMENQDDFEKIFFKYLEIVLN